MHLAQCGQNLTNDVLSLAQWHISRNLNETVFLIAAGFHLKTKFCKKIFILFDQPRFFLVKRQQLMNQQLL